MRALTVNELEVVSGGESPCITLQTQCIDPENAPTPGEFLGGTAVILNFVGEVYKPASVLAKALAIVAFFTLTAEKRDAAGGEGQGGGGGGDSDKKKEIEEKRTKN